MGRERKYADDAERQRAYRERKAKEFERLQREAGTAPKDQGKFRPKGPKEFRITLARVLGMLRSENAHQREIAALKATELQQKSGLSWYDLLGVKEPEMPK